VSNPDDGLVGGLPGTGMDGWDGNGAPVCGDSRTGLHAALTAFRYFFHALGVFCIRVLARPPPPV
jgi:hypothetical protein